MAKKKIIDTGHPDLFEEAAKRLAEQEEARRLAEEKSKKPPKGTTRASSRGYVEPDSWHLPKNNSISDFKLEGDIIQTPAGKEEPVQQKNEPKAPQKRPVSRIGYEEAMWTLFIFNQLLTGYASMTVAREEIAQAQMDKNTYLDSKKRFPGQKLIQFGAEYIRAVHNRDKYVQGCMENIAEEQAKCCPQKTRVLYHARSRYAELLSKINRALEKE